MLIGADANDNKRLKPLRSVRHIERFSPLQFIEKPMRGEAAPSTCPKNHSFWFLGQVLELLTA